MSDELENRIAKTFSVEEPPQWMKDIMAENEELKAELASLRARPQEPGLSKEWLDELLLPIQRELYLATFKMIPQESIDWQCGFDAGSMQLAEAMINAILAALAAPVLGGEK